MVYQEDFAVERWMDEYETKAELNISETCCESLSITQLETVLGKKFPTDALLNQRLLYGAIPGSQQLRSTVADMYNETSSGPIKMTADNVLITNGAIGANFLLYYSLVGPGDHVIIVNPVYQQLKSVPAVFGGKVDELQLREENGYLPDLDELRRLVKKGQTKLININTPHNPSGSVIPEEMLEEIVAIAKEADAYLVCDEVYRPLFHSLPEGFKEPSSPVSMYSKAISTGSMSKAFAMAGLRLGWIVTADKDALTECLKRRDYNTISVSILDDLIAAWALAGRAKLLAFNAELCRRNLKIVDKFVADAGDLVSLYRPRAGTTMFLRIKGVKDTRALCVDMMDKHGTLLVPGETFDSPGYVRIGFANNSDDLTEGFQRFLSYLNSKDFKKLVN